MRPMANVVGALVQRRTITSHLGWPPCFTGREPVPCRRRSAATQDVEAQGLGGQSEHKNERLFSFSSVATEC